MSLEGLAVLLANRLGIIFGIRSSIICCDGNVSPVIMGLQVSCIIQRRW